MEQLRFHGSDKHKKGKEKMKRILTTILVFLGLLTVGVSIGANAAEGESSFKIVFKDATSDSSSTLTASSIKQQIDDSSTVTDEISSYSVTKVYASKTGLKFGSKSDRGSITLNFNKNYKVTTVIVNAKTYGSNSLDTSQVSINGTDYKSADLTASFADYTYNVENPTESSSLKVGISGVRGFVKSIEVKYSAGTTYEVSFDANGGTFLADKGASISGTIGESTNVPLPTREDLTTPDGNFAVLSKWSDGTNKYDPGTTVPVNKGTKFTAEYVSPADPISVADAITIAKATGETNTTLKYSVVATISTIDYAYTTKNDSISVTLTQDGSSIKVFKMTHGQDLAVGDVIKVTGKIVNYNNNTPEFVAGCTYEVVTGLVKSFVASETKTSLIVTYDGDLNPTDVDLRFGGIIAANAYNADAKYGVLVVLAGENKPTAGKTEYATADDFIAANEGYQKIECTPAQVADGYQFAWVINDVEQKDYKTQLTGVMYMEYNGVLYICNAKTSSVGDTVLEYTETDIYTGDLATVLDNVFNLC